MWEDKQLFVSRLVSTMIALSFIACSLGCSNEHPELRGVSGLVTYNDAPVADATVAFYSDNSMRMATGRTDAEGRFSLTSFEANDGAPSGRTQSGRHKVRRTGRRSTQFIDGRCRQRETQPNSHETTSP